MRGHYTPPGGPRIDAILSPVSSSPQDEAHAAQPRYTVTFIVASHSQAQPGEGDHLPSAEALRNVEAALGQIDSAMTAASLVEKMNAAAEAAEGLGEVQAEDLAIAIRRTFEHATDWSEIDFEVIHGPTVDPMINVALDETLAKDVAAGKRKPFMRMWEWTGTQVVLGSYQSYANELHADGVAKHNVVVSRRVSGGGTMFMEAAHSITFSLVVPTSLVAGMSFEQAYPFLDQWVMEVLGSLGVKAHYVPLNDIASDHGKIAGAAQKRWVTGYMLHHVTMAYDMDSGKMLEVLRTGLDKVHDKGTRSAVKWVDPLRSQIDLPREAVIQAMIDHFTASYNATPSTLTEDELDAAAIACATKFSTEEWIYRLP